MAVDLSTITADINSLIPDNTSQLISAQDVRERFIQIVDWLSARVVNNVAALTSLPRESSFAFIKGHTTEADGGEGVLYWSATATPDAISVFTDGASGGWVRLGNILTPEMGGIFGYSSDTAAESGNVDATSIIQAMFTAHNNGTHKVDCKRGWFYRCESALTVDFTGDFNFPGWIYGPTAGRFQQLTVSRGAQAPRGTFKLAGVWRGPINNPGWLGDGYPLVFDESTAGTSKPHCRAQASAETNIGVELDGLQLGHVHIGAVIGQAIGVRCSGKSNYFQGMRVSVDQTSGNWAGVCLLAGDASANPTRHMSEVELALGSQISAASNYQGNSLCGTFIVDDTANGLVRGPSAITIKGGFVEAGDPGATNFNDAHQVVVANGENIKCHDQRVDIPTWYSHMRVFRYGTLADNPRRISARIGTRGAFEGGVFPIYVEEAGIGAKQVSLFSQSNWRNTSLFSGDQQAGINGWQFYHTGLASIQDTVWGDGFWHDYTDPERPILRMPSTAVRLLLRGGTGYTEFPQAALINQRRCQGFLRLNVEGTNVRYSFRCYDFNGTHINATINGLPAIANTAEPSGFTLSAGFWNNNNNLENPCEEITFHDTVKTWELIITGATIGAISVDAVNLPGAYCHKTGRSDRKIAAYPQGGVWHESEETRVVDAIDNAVIKLVTRTPGRSWRVSGPWSSGMTIKRGLTVSVGAGPYDIWQIEDGTPPANGGTNQPNRFTPNVLAIGGSFEDDAGANWRYLDTVTNLTQFDV